MEGLLLEGAVLREGKASKTSLVSTSHGTGVSYKYRFAKLTPEKWGSIIRDYCF